MPSVTLTGGNDTYSGDQNNADTIHGLGGDDRLSGLGGQDVLHGEAGADLLLGGNGNDTLLGGDDADTLFGGDGHDLLDGGAGDDVLGRASGDGAGQDQGNNTLLGGEGNDLLWGSNGKDTLEGGAGDDTLVAGQGRALFDGGDGDDWLDLSRSPEQNSVSLNLATGAASGGTLAGASIAGTAGDSSVEHVIGTSGNDTITGDDAANRLLGGNGTDSLTGGGGDDTLEGGAGGTDTAVYAGARAGYAVTTGTDSLGAWTRVTDTDATDGDEGTDLLYGIEALQFADAVDPICFLPGTLIATPAGEVPVESLRPGDAVLTAGGGTAPVRWLGRQTISTRFADPLRVNPIRIRAGALAEGVPSRDLLLSPCHAVLLGDILVQAGALVNGTSILRDPPPAVTFTYWHVELDGHALVMANATPAESFIDNADRLAFDNWAEHEALFPEGRPIEEMPLPRAKSWRQVPPHLRALLARRAATLAGPTAGAAGTAARAA
jgi:Ca2+-binding RTX toxin-like protein